MQIVKLIIFTKANLTYIQQRRIKNKDESIFLIFDTRDFSFETLRSKSWNNVSIKTMIDASTINSQQNAGKENACSIYL